MNLGLFGSKALVRQGLLFLCHQNTLAVEFKRRIRLATSRVSLNLRLLASGIVFLTLSKNNPRQYDQGSDNYWKHPTGAQR